MAANKTNAQVIKLTKDLTPFAKGDTVLVTDAEFEILAGRAKRHGIENWHKKEGKRVFTDRQPLDGFEALRNDEEVNANPDNVIADTADGEVVADTGEQGEESGDSEEESSEEGEQLDLEAEAEKAKQARAEAKANKSK